MTAGGSRELLCPWGLQEGLGRLWTGTPSQDGVLAVAARPQCQLGMVAQPLGSHSPRDTVGQGLELCGPVHVPVSPVLPAPSPGLGQGLPRHSRALEELLGHQALESRLASPRGDWVTRNAWDGEPGSLALNEQRMSLRGRPWGGLVKPPTAGGQGAGAVGLLGHPSPGRRRSSSPSHATARPLGPPRDSPKLQGTLQVDVPRCTV